jgi:AraC-like DNA-binding protein
MSYDRILPMVPAENIIIVTNEQYAPLVMEQLPELKPEQILLEPARRNTAPCIAWAAYHIAARDPEASMIVTPSDHIITRQHAFEECVNSGFDFVENNCEKSCTLEDLSAAIGHNSAYLSRYFSESTNMTFLSLVNRYRISRACHILKNSNRSVTECAYECGYKSLRSFNRNFISYIGMPPREYRKNQKKDK